MDSNQASDDSWRSTQLRRNVVARINQAIVQSGVSIQRPAQVLESQIFSKSNSKQEYGRLILGLIDHIKQRSSKLSSDVLNEQRTQNFVSSQAIFPNAPEDTTGFNTQMKMSVPVPQRQSKMLQIQQSFQGIFQQSETRRMMPRSLFHQRIQQQQTEISQVSANQQSMGNIQLKQDMLLHGQQVPNSAVSKRVQQVELQIDTQQGLPGNRMEINRNLTPPNIIIGPQRTMDSSILQKALQQGSKWTISESNGLPFISVMQHQSPNRQETPLRTYQRNQLPSTFSQELSNVEKWSPTSKQVDSQAGSRLYSRVVSSERSASGSQLTGQLSPTTFKNTTPTRKPYQAVASSQNISPASSLNTPLTSPNTGAGSDSRRAIFNKIMQMQKYKTLLNKLLLKSHQDSIKYHKLKKLMDILDNPHKTVPMEMLLKYELAMKTIARQYQETRVLSDQRASSSHTDTISPFQQIQNAILCTLRNVSSDPTQPRTNVEKVIPQAPSKYNATDSESSSEEDSKSGIPLTLRKELQFLDKRYGFELANNDGTAESQIVYITLEDSQLPKVPPLKVVISEGYPMVKPTLLNFNKEYDCNPFFRGVASAMKYRFSCMASQPTLTVTEITTCWETSVRQTAASLCTKGSKGVGSKSTLN